MKLSKEELIEKVNGLVIDDEVKISLLEDILILSLVNFSIDTSPSLL